MSREWLEPWFPIENMSLRLFLEQELQHELCDGHVLWKSPVLIVAKRSDQDDILASLPDGRVAEIHLTWSKRPEVDPRWPTTKIFNSIDDWRDASMKPVHEEFKES
jgi:hypothetical protein